MNRDRHKRSPGKKVLPKAAEPDPLKRDPIVKLNNATDAHQVPWAIHESVIEYILHQWRQLGKPHLPQYWLITVRLFEMAILCAGHYVDNCGITAADDLLFNPRKILIYQKGNPRPCVKHRHGWLCDQLRGHKHANELFAGWVKHRAATHITESGSSFKHRIPKWVVAFGLLRRFQFFKVFSPVLPPGS